MVLSVLTQPEADRAPVHFVREIIVPVRASQARHADQPEADQHNEID